MRAISSTYICIYSIRTVKKCKKTLTVKSFFGVTVFALFNIFDRIEHLEDDILHLMPQVIFGQLSPKIAIITTPNVEFNVLFPNFQGFRHHDHKFEWTRAQFQEW